MANILYDPGRQAFLEGSINWLTDTIKVQLLDTANYTVASTHQFLSQVSTAAWVGAAQTLTAKDATYGVAAAANVTVSALSGPTVEAILIYKESTAGSSASPLVAYIDTASGLPVTPNGGDININWSTGVNKVFKL